MATFFMRGRLRERVNFELVDGASGRVYPDNAYRFREGNQGYRVEVDTDLARSLDLVNASRRSDIVLFRRIGPNRYVIELHPSRTPAARELIQAGVAEGRVHLTVPGARGRRYYL